MAGTDTNKPIAESGAESPTTARPLEMDDDDIQETGVLGGDSATSTQDKPKSTTASDNNAATAPTTLPNAPAPTTQDEAPPAKPPRPLTEAQKNEATLKEAFPSVDSGVIRAVLRASGGRVEPAFNALLEMTDPDAAKNEPEEAAPPQPPRPRGQGQLSQMEADEIYARQLAEHYNNVGAYEHRTSNRGGTRSTQQRPGQFDSEDREHSFMDDDLPVIRENLRQGFLETQTRVNGWIDFVKKKIDENFDESEEQHQRSYGNYGRPGEPSRRSGDYDADPQVLSDDFAGMKFNSDGTPTNRTATFPGPQRGPSASPRPSDGRRVGFKEETEEINMYETSPQVPPKDTPPAKASKWQPLSAVEPSPIGDNDPFSLGDSEDERDNANNNNNAALKDGKDKPKDAAQEDTDRLKKAAAEAMADSLVDEKDGDTAGAKKT